MDSLIKKEERFLKENKEENKKWGMYTKLKYPVQLEDHIVYYWSSWKTEAVEPEFAVCVRSKAVDSGYHISPNPIDVTGGASNLEETAEPVTLQTIILGIM